MTAPGPKLSIDQPAFGDLIAMFEEQGRVFLRQLDDFGDQEELPRHAPAGQRGFELFVDDPLMGGVLVHDHDAIGGLGDDVGLV